MDGSMVGTCHFSERAYRNLMERAYEYYVAQGKHYQYELVKIVVRHLAGRRCAHLRDLLRPEKVGQGDFGWEHYPLFSTTLQRYLFVGTQSSPKILSTTTYHIILLHCIMN